MITAVAVSRPSLYQIEISKCGWSTNRLGDWSDRPRLNRTPFWFPTVGGYSEFGCGLVKDVTKCSGGSNVESGPREVRPATCL